MRSDCPLMIVYKMLQNILFRVHCTANRLDRAASLRIWLDWSHRLSVRMSIRVVKMPISMRYGRDTVDSKTDSIARSSLSRSLLSVFVGYLLCWEQFWMLFLFNFPSKYNEVMFIGFFDACRKPFLVFIYLGWCSIWCDERRLTNLHDTLMAVMISLKCYRRQVQKPFLIC